MIKMQGAAPFLHRRSGFSRYGLMAIIFLAALWCFRRNSDSFARTDSTLNQQMPASGKTTMSPLDVDRTATKTPSSQPSKDVPGSKLQPSSQKVDKTTRPSAGNKASTPTESRVRHPIDKLIYDAQLSFAALVAGESKTVGQAAQAYRKRRGRHPPPHFDKWFEFAQSHNALIVEDFFDQIYQDLEPFWGVDPAPMRREASQFEMTINIRDGVADAGSQWPWTQIWLNMTRTVAHLLPDMDLALNAMDEPRLVVPWEEINGYVQNASKSLKLAKAKKMKNEFRPWPKPRTGSLSGKITDQEWEKDEFYWKIARRGCPPDSAARVEPLQTLHGQVPEISKRYAEPHLYQGYVSNYTKSVELCHQPDLQTLEGILIHPLSTSSTKTFFPMFGGSKLTVNNEILLPAPMYWNEEERFGGGDDHGVDWTEKDDKVIWRGVATGGKNTADNWRGFQRHRFISMNNGTKVDRVESGEDKAENFVLPDTSYAVKAHKDMRLGDWIDDFADVGFIDLMCDPPEDGLCNYTNFYFETLGGLKMAEQYDNKYLPDIDGNSFSGRYLGFLRSTSLPIKATIFREWHDTRLTPWKHFVPMDSRFVDYYGIMEYFLGYQGQDSHDKTAERIALEGKEWAEKVLRKEDMSVYVLRLLLEYARVMDDDRESMGWVDDVIKDPTLEKSWAWWW